MKEFTVEKPVPYYEQFYHTIKEMIFRGDIKPGERINETQLAKDFNVSKSPVREAIRILEKEGLVIVNDKSRVIVYEPTIQDVEEIYFCRKALESFAVRHATQIASDEEIAEIERLLADTERAIVQNETPEQIISMNEQFHNLIIRFTKNARLQKQLNELRGLIRYYRVLNFEGEQRAEVILAQHREIFKHMKERHEEKAAQEMIRHLDLDTEHLVEVLKFETEE